MFKLFTMKKYIKYKRFTEKFELNDNFKYNTQEFLDKLITLGFEIIHYDEYEEKVINKIPVLHITVVAGKRQNNFTGF